MRRTLLLLPVLPALLAAQPATLDQGRLDPSWFGPAAALQPSKPLGFQWLKPGQVLQRRSIRVKAWEPPVWLAGPRRDQDQLLFGTLEEILVPRLAKALGRELKGLVPVSLAAGDVLLVGRVVDAVGASGDGSSSGVQSLSFDLKLLDGDTGDLIGGFHATLEGLNADALVILYGRWCEQLGKLLASAARPAGAAPPAVPAGVPARLVPAPEPFDLEGALRRIEGLRRDGLLSEEECALLRRKAAAKAR